MDRYLSFNKQWLYKPSFDEAYTSADAKLSEEAGFESIVLPHTNLEVPYNYFDEKSYQFVSTYVKHFDYEAAWEGKKVYLEFGAVMTYAEVYLNGQLITSHKGGYTPFTADLSDALQAGSNQLVVKVDSTERDDIPPFGYVIDYLCFGGIYREVELRVSDPVHIDNIKTEASSVLDAEKRSLKTKVFIKNTIASSDTVSLELSLSDTNGTLVAQTETALNLDASSEQIVELDLTALSSAQLWTLEEPTLYHVEVKLSSASNNDHYKTRIGFRTAEFTNEGFLLNGEKIFIRGLNRHQSYPYVGYAMPARAQREDADVLKNELGLNLARTSHYPQSKAFLDRCDEIGLLVFEEIPGWQHIGDLAWQEVAKENVREMIVRDWNHPSIVLWGVRINESGDSHDFYTDTNRIARELDSTRQTGGVRCYEGSEFLEDVFTFNDFILGNQANGPAIRDPRQVTRLDHDVPYMITEYNGHMYPTKKLDGDERQQEHTLRHVKVLDAAANHPNVSGAIGWCAFDYNTHLDFGSGDKICYHGVMDMYRQPKFAAYAYRSQAEGENAPMLEAITIYSRGDKSGGAVVPFMLLTNCDYVELVKDGRTSGPFYPDSENFPGLKHAPVIIRDTLGEWGAAWSDAKFVGYIDGEVAIERDYLASPTPETLSVEAASSELNSDEFDATRVDVRLLDKAGNPLFYTDQIVEFSVEGQAEVIGPRMRPLSGGTTAVWLKSLADGSEGTIRLSAKAAGLSSTVELKLSK